MNVVKMKNVGGYMNFTDRSIGYSVALFALATALSGCSGGSFAPTSNATISSSSAAVGKVALSVSDSNGNLIYSDASVSTAQSLTLVAGRNYSINLAESNAVAGTSYVLKLVQTNIVSGSSSSIPLQLGANTFTVPVQGDYSLQLVTTVPTGASSTAYYVAEVSCASPTFTASSLNASAISASQNTSAGAQNMFTLSASGVTSSANGMAPYTCAWDPTGTGIQDTAFASCSSAVSPFYSNFLGMRDVHLLVKDACNTVVSIDKSVNFVSSEPSMPGNTFITGQVSGATGSVVGDPRVDSVNYLATNQNYQISSNQNANDIVKPLYSQGGFEIYSSLNYGRPSSVQFGIDLKLTGITGSINVSTGAGSIDVSAATIASVNYSTDQAGDSSAAVSLAGSNCTLSNQGKVVQFIAGTPCTNGLSGDSNQAKVEVYGHYSCSGLSATGATISIEGDFDGVDLLQDSCSGGGGGGGGLQPVAL